jgi:transcription initiation factor IIE alpha subunit
MNHRNPKQSILAENRVTLLKETVVRAMTERKTYRLALSDKELSELAKIPLRSTRRYLKCLIDRGVFEVQRKRHLHHSLGWCNERTIFLTPTYQIVAQRRNQ